jgi:transposase
MYVQATTTYGSLIPGSEYIRSLIRQGTISKDAAKRLRWMDHYARSQNARQTCRYFGISAQTFYRWKNRYDPYDLTTLEEESRRPRHVRQPKTPVKRIERIRELREEHPRWGRDKLAVLLKREGVEISGSTVGREMKKLKARGLLVEPENVRQAKLARKRRRKPRYAVRKPKGYADFLHHLKTKFPFRIKAIQIDGGSEFMDQFEEACRRAKIRLFLNPHRHPEMNGGVERSNRTHREEFYEVEDVSLDVGEHNKQLAKYEYCHNYIRPHRALHMQTPYEYYLQWKRTRRAQVSRMS